jgi:hypothetical protein
MNKFKLVISLLALLACADAFASGTFCSGFSIHYSENRVDLGIPPPPGLRLGEQFLAQDGTLLGKIEFFQDQPSVGDFPYQVDITNKKTLARHGDPGMGWEVFSADFTATKPGDSNPIQESVVCKTTWAIVP